MYVFAIDRDGRLGGCMSRKTAAKVVASGRAKWVGLNCVQFPKRFKRAVPLEKLFERGIPLLDTACPEVVWMGENGEYEVRDVAARPRGKEVQETLHLCREAWLELRREEAAASALPETAGALLEILGLVEDIETDALSETAGALQQILGLMAGEKAVKEGFPDAPKKKREEEKPGPLSVITGALPPLKRYTPADIGAGLTGRARKTARRRAFQKLAAMYEELHAYFNLPHWSVKIGDRYVSRDYLLDTVQNLIDRFWKTDPTRYWEYRHRLDGIVIESQAPAWH
ncbi:hypothetical protein [Desulfovirgula thermocuniculi]|uniref:hypothetical protein n=1 Tax=Desulfovirgula thermocuniculi TaxID=348842 RepID=UPI0003FBD78A|nr:hypothetical protein [Desulfovirgula thermocuniculi]